MPGMDVYTLHFDGSCAPNNPGGTAAYGYIIAKQNMSVMQHCGIIGSGPKMSNNLAEFTALAQGLKVFECYFAMRGVILNVFGDSMVVINIMTRNWKARPGKLYWPAYTQAADLLRLIRSTGTLVTFDHIHREQNQ